jgi:hypothetical protein
MPGSTPDFEPGACGIIVLTASQSHPPPINTEPLVKVPPAMRTTAQSATCTIRMTIINVFYCNRAFVDPIGLNLNKQKGRHNTLLKELGGRLVIQVQIVA